MDEVLTVGQEHLLKRELLRQQISVESAALDNMINIDRLGPPFVLPSGQMASGEDSPLFSYVLHYFVTTFPLLRGAKPQFWQHSAQPFIQGLASKDISSSADRDEATKRRRIGRIFKRMLLIMYVAGLGSNRPKPKGTVPLPNPAQSKMEDSQDVASMQASNNSSEAPEGPDASVHPGPYASVIGVRQSAPSGMFKQRHSEYILESCFWGGKPVWVARSWADFVALHQKLTRQFPGKALARLPRKNLKDTTADIAGTEQVLLREPQRTTLRHYVSILCGLPKVANSDVFLDFLFKDPLPSLSPAEVTDVESRLALDRTRAADRERFVLLAREREARLDNDIGEIKKEVLLEDALPRLVLDMKTHERIEDMDPLLQKFVDWCLVQVASVLYDVLIARDDSPEIFAQIKRLHGMIPYKVVQGILKMSNPALILKKLTDLFMATPFGGRSLIQSMLIRILADDIRNQKVLITELEDRLRNPQLVDILTEYTTLDHWTREALATTAQQEDVDLVCAIIRDSPQANKSLKRKVNDWHTKWQAAVKGEGEEDLPEVETYSQLKDLLKLKVRQRDKDVMQQFWADQSTIQFVRDVVDLCYDVLIEVFRYARVADSVGDLERFMTDLIAFVEYANSMVALNAPQLVDKLLELLRRHQNGIFRFIHRVYRRDDGFFVDMVNWMSLFVNFVKDGKAGRHDLDLLGLVRNHKTVDVVKLREELNALQEWLDRRRATASDPALIPPKEAVEEFPTTDGVNGSNNPHPTTFDVSDVGLSWDDVDFGLAEVERDNHEEFVAEMHPDLSQDAVTQDRVRRRRQAEMEARKALLKPRPEMRETAKLLPEFARHVHTVLRSADLKPTRLQDLQLPEKTA